MTRPDHPDRPGRPGRPGRGPGREPVTGEAEVRDAPDAYPFTTAPAPAEGPRERSSRTMQRLRSDPETVERDLVKLVLTLVELIRQLMERQALRRADGGDLSADQVEALGLALMRLDEAMTRLKDHFGLDDHDLNLDLGPLGPLLPED
ncbi:gas vesicle protein K [Actinomadura sp. KC06]|uniref:gas vesicle protein K n=1 Tax=Actinomadura sp. KC06 TaxID=2530369 RepID=UPI001FB582C9|nr:gas vesicle protein K [Actinomadura sp. KC06]